ncbi:MAG: formyl transferase [Bacteroidetes bacterium]|nr:formyl transferase [Bacteroidota bacterium]
MVKKVAVIGRSEWLFNTMNNLVRNGYEIPLVITAKEAPEYKYSSKDFESFARKNGAHFMHNPAIKKSDIQKILRQSGEIPIAVSVNYTGIIPQDVIDLFPLGILNAHGGDLPRYRGNACQAWAILNGEKKIGLCVHKMVGGKLDAGDIIARNYLPININIRIREIYEWFEKEIPELMLSSIRSLEKDKNFILEKQSVVPEEVLRCYPRIPEDGRIDWKMSGEEILRLINASSEPYAGAFAYLNGKMIRIWRASLVYDGENYLAIPGQICLVQKEGSVLVATQHGKIKIELISLEEGKDKFSPGKLITSIRTRLN